MANMSMDLLKKEVLEPGLCVACGGCVGLCPHISFFDGKVICTDVCDLDDGRCYRVCPVATQMERTSSKKDSAGVLKSIHRSRTTDNGIRGKAQYGGTVSTLIIVALEEGLIDEAILTSNVNGMFPHGVSAKTKEDVMCCSGSRYSSSAALEEFNKRAKSSSRLGVVALPCQAQSLVLAKNTLKDTEIDKPEAELILGLFCTWALKYRPFRDFLSTEGITDKSPRYDIPPPPANVFQILTDKETREVPLSNIRDFIHSGCALCEDLTAEHADISVGAVEGMDDWNTLIIRTEKGKQLIDLAVNKSLLELENLPDENCDHLYEAARLKRKRGKQNRNKRKKK